MGLGLENLEWNTLFLMKPEMHDIEKSIADLLYCSHQGGITMRNSHRLFYLDDNKSVASCPQACPQLPRLFIQVKLNAS